LPLGTMQWLNQRLASRPGLDFINAILRGIGQVIFANNPVSGALLLAAMMIQAPWLGVMTLAGVIAATLTAKLMRLSPAAIQNGVFGLSGMLIGAALGFAGRSGNGPWNPMWIAAAVLLSTPATVVMHAIGTWFATRLKALTATAIGGVFYAPNRRSIAIVCVPSWPRPPASRWRDGCPRCTSRCGVAPKR
jgi:urea transporter